MLRKLAADLRAIKHRDPAFGSYVTAPFIYPSFQVLLAHRIANPIWRAGIRFPARLLMQIARWITGIEIHPGATIGPGLFIDHGMGVVIGETAEIGRDVTLYHGVTLGGVMPAIGAAEQRCVKRHPTLSDYVIVGAGAQILGAITIGKCARVGGNSVVTRDVADGITVVGVPARPVPQKQTADEGFTAYAITPETSEDFREKTILGLSQELAALRQKVDDLRQEDDRLAPRPQIDDDARANLKK
ncbi:MAG: serine O-acetyltransferase EpsC [Candidatus Puniceispirillaceae bacterium]